jgi:hypothetical protein
LHDVPDDAELVEVAAAALGPEGFLESDDHGGDVVAVPGRPEQAVAEPDGHQVLDHLLAQVVVNAIKLLLSEVLQYKTFFLRH